MAMTRYTDEPGSPAWHARRARCFNAGDASAMLGCHPSGKTRTQLLQELHTGLEREFSDYVQERVIDPGHRVEALWRPVAEEIIGEDLQVYGASLDVGLSRPLGASLDAATFMEDTLGECKSANDALRAALPHTGRDSHARNDARQLPKGYRVQMDQQQLVTGATRTLFSACQFDADGNPTEERHCWYTSDPELRAEILAGWKQFDVDLAAYAPATASPAEKIVAEPVEALPAVSVKVEGSIVIRENFDAFEAAMRNFLDHRLIRTPKTDQDFADLEVQIKAMKGAEAALDGAEAGWIAQIEPVSIAKRRKDMLRSLVRENRLLAEKLFSSEKERRRGELVAEAIEFLRAHVNRLNTRLGAALMPASATAVDFALVIKGMRSLASMQDAIDTRLAAAKIAGNEMADRIAANLKALDSVAPEHAALFPDRAAIVLKAPDDLQALVRARVAEHDAAMKHRAEEAAEKERARIRAEEEARAREQARREQEAREAEERRVRAAAEEQQRQEAEALQRRQREEEAARAQQQREQQVLPTAVAGGGAVGEGADAVRIVVTAPDVPAASPAVIQMPARAPAAAPAGLPTLRLGEIQKRIVPLSIDAAGLAALGFPFVKQEGSAKLWHESSFPAILDAAIAQLARAKLKQLEAA